MDCLSTIKCKGCKNLLPRSEYINSVNSAKITQKCTSCRKIDSERTARSYAKKKSLAPKKPATKKPSRKTHPKKTHYANYSSVEEEPSIESRPRRGRLAVPFLKSKKVCAPGRTRALVQAITVLIMKQDDQLIFLAMLITLKCIQKVVLTRSPTYKFYVPTVMHIRLISREKVTMNKV